MRKTTFFLLAIILPVSLLITYCCKKSSQSAPPNPNEAVIDKVKAWLDGQKAASTVLATATTIQSLKDNLDFSTLRSETYVTGRQLLVIAVGKGFKTKNYPELNPVGNLVLIAADSGITKGYISEYIPLNAGANNTVPVNSFSKIFTSKKLDCDGKFAFLTIADGLLYELNYANGRVQSYSKVQPKAKAATGGKAEGCWEVDLITYYTDGSQTSQWLYDYCDGECQGTRVVGNKAIRADCGGGGGGGTGAPEDCCIADPNITPDFQTVSETESDPCGLEGLDATNTPIKTCTHQWKFSNNTLLFYSWSYASVESADMAKIDGAWQFKKITHSGVNTEGGLPPCVNCTCNVTSTTPSISGTKNTGRMDIIFNLQFNITCCPVCNPYYSPGSASTTWPAQ